MLYVFCGSKIEMKDIIDNFLREIILIVIKNIITMGKWIYYLYAKYNFLVFPVKLDLQVCLACIVFVKQFDACFWCLCCVCLCSGQVESAGGEFVQECVSQTAVDGRSSCVCQLSRSRDSGKQVQRLLTSWTSTQSAKSVTNLHKQQLILYFCGKHLLLMLWSRSAPRVLLQHV